MDRLRRTIALLALAVLGGGIVVLHAVVLPVMTAHPLLDANLAGAVAAPVRASTTNLMIAGAVIVIVLAPRILPAWGSWTAGLLGLVLLFDRLWLLPRAEEAWSRVDRVTGRPVDHLAQALAYADMQILSVAAMGLLFLLVVWCWAGRWASPTASSRQGQVHADPVAACRSEFTSSPAAG